MQTQMDKQQIVMKMYLVSRIEDQCVERFDKKYPTEMYDPEKELPPPELKKVIIEWLEYWHNERPIIKIPNFVQEIKQKVCDTRIYRILVVASENNLFDEIPEYLRNGYEFELTQECAESVQLSHGSCLGQLQS